METTTPEEREQAHVHLKKQYEVYEEFLKTAATEPVEPFEVTNLIYEFSR